jgi:hypothetical protein
VDGQAEGYVMKEAAKARKSILDAPRLKNPRDFVRIEIRKALARNIPVVPVILDGAPIPEERSLQADMRELAQRHAEFIDFWTFLLSG